MANFETSIWYRTGGTVNFKWHVAWADDRPALVAKLHAAGYSTVEAAREPTEYAPAGYRRSAVEEARHGN